MYERPSLIFNSCVLFSDVYVSISWHTIVVVSEFISGCLHYAISGQLYNAVILFRSSPCSLKCIALFKDVELTADSCFQEFRAAWYCVLTLCGCSAAIWWGTTASVRKLRCVQGSPPSASQVARSARWIWRSCWRMSSRKHRHKVGLTNHTHSLCILEVRTRGHDTVTVHSPVSLSCPISCTQYPLRRTSWWLAA